MKYKFVLSIDAWAVFFARVMNSTLENHGCLTLKYGQYLKPVRKRADDPEQTLTFNLVNSRKAEAHELIQLIFRHAFFITSI
jgi:hypothetical protein